MRRTIAILIAVTLILLPMSASSVSAPWGAYRGYPQAKVLVNGSEVISPDVPAHIADGRTLVPLRFVTEALGASVEWDEPNYTVVVTSPSKDSAAEIESLKAELARLENRINEVISSLTSPSAVAAKVKPSVVGIIATKRLVDGEELIDQGTGVIMSDDGMIITNTHVIKQKGIDTVDIYVILNDGRAIKGELWNYDYVSDIAVVKVSAPNLVVAEFGDSDKVEVGQQVLAIGNPLSLGLMNTVTAGVVSGLNRADQSAYPLIQTDAAINGGNSGGPLVDYQGKVIAITSSKIFEPGVEGLGFAIPINLAKDIINRFSVRGVVRPFVGMVVEESYFAGLGVLDAQGLTIVEVAPDSPAFATGLKVSDLLQGVNEKSIKTLVELRYEIEKYAPGDAVSLTVKRGSEILTLSVKLSELATEDYSPFEYGALYPWEAEF